MDREDLKRFAEKYRLARMVIGGNDLSEGYIEGWKDRSRYIF